MASQSDAQGSSLAQKLDSELDEYIEGMIEKNKDYKYEGRLTEDNWEEEIKKIPLFTRPEDLTQELIDSSPELQAMQQMRYEHDDPVDAAVALKEDGNYSFGKKKYKFAIVAYTEALKEKHSDFVLFATLYTNRGAANFHLGNNRSALNDAMRALYYKPDHMKAIVRCALCCFDLERYDDCVGFCDRGLLVEPGNEKLTELIRKAKHQKKQQERDARKEQNRKVRNMTKLNRLYDAIEERRINIESTSSTSVRQQIERLVESDPSKPHHGKIYLDDSDALHWPVYFLYPQSSQSDFIEDFHESQTFADHIRIVFEVLPDWDTERKYTQDNVEVYFEDCSQEKLVHVNRNMNLRTVLSDPRYLLRAGCPAFMMLSTKSKFFKGYKEAQDAEEF